MKCNLDAARRAVPEEPILADEQPVIRLMRTVAVLGMIFGIAGIIALPFGLGRLHTGSFAGDVRVHRFSPLIESPTIDGVWMDFSSASGAGLALLLFLGSIAAINFSPIGRPALILWSIGSLALGFIGSFFYFRWLYSPSRQGVSQVRGVVDSLAIFGGWGIGSILAMVMLFLLTRPAVKAAFERAEPI